tara:strand:+ start:44750 stop:45148 length:399 start_codon:yes stop_codon:yes gene_type:complete
MYIQKLEQSLLHPTMQVLAELKVYSQSNNISELGYLYTCFRKLDKKLLLGFTRSIELIEGPLFEKQFLIIGNRHGRESELNLLKSTLNELGHFKSQNSDAYKFSKSLIKHLELLGWPIGKLSNNNYSKKFND